MSEIHDPDPSDLLPEGAAPLAAILPAKELHRLISIERAARAFVAAWKEPDSGDRVAMAASRINAFEDLNRALAGPSGNG